MAFEKEIKAATKIADEWMERSVRDYDFLIGMKKNGVAWEKDTVKRIEGVVNSGAATGALADIKTCRIWLDDYTEQCEAVFEKHAKFILGDPRGGSAGICNAIGLKAKDAAYEPVKTAMGKKLIDHTKQFKTTEQAWTTDLKVRIDLLKSKLDTLENLANGADKKMDAYGKQFHKDRTAHEAQMEGALSGVKESMAELAIQKITSDPGAWCSGNAKIQSDQYSIFKDRVVLIDKLCDQFDKNFKRVLKNVPEDVRDKFMFKKALGSFAATQKKSIMALRGAQGKFKTAAAVFEKNYPALV